MSLPTINIIDGIFFYYFLTEIISGIIPPLMVTGLFVNDPCTIEAISKVPHAE